MHKRNCFMMAVALFAIVLTPLMVEAQQPGGPGGRGGRGFGGFGGRGGAGGGNSAMLMVALVRNDKVQKELELIDEQVADATKLIETLRGGGEREQRPNVDFRNLSEEDREKMRKEFEEARAKREKEIREKLGTILLPPQLERLEQIVLQLQGIGALNDPQVQEKLKITEEQQKKMASVREEMGESMRARMQELFQGGRENIDRDKMREEFTKMQEEVSKKTLAVLTSDQQKQFDEMKGPEFEVSMADLFQGGRGGDGGRGGFGRGGRGGPGGRGGEGGGRPQRPARPE